MDVLGGEHRDSGMSMLGVVPWEEGPAESGRDGDIFEPPGEAGMVLQGLELCLGEGVVIADLRAAERAGLRSRGIVAQRVLRVARPRAFSSCPARRGLRGTIRTIHEDSRGTYGVPPVHAELVANGCRVSRKRVARLMREGGLTGVSRLRGTRTTRVDSSHRAAPDRVQRQFQADAPDRIWVADIERHEALLNLAVVRDHRRRPVAAGRLKLRAA